MPISISSTPIWKVGLPAAGTVHEVNATPIDAVAELTARSWRQLAPRYLLGWGARRGTLPAPHRSRAAFDD